MPGQDQRVFYGGTTAAEIQDRGNDRIGIQHWAKNGIAGTVRPFFPIPSILYSHHCPGRGVLIDYASYAEQRGLKVNTFSPHEITLADIHAIAKASNLTFQPGDILFMRVGVTRDWDTKMDLSAKMDYATKPMPTLAGVEPTKDMLRWIWDSGFAAVAGDSIAFEVWPPRNPEVMLHEYLLAGWGMPIGEHNQLMPCLRCELTMVCAGELFDLEALAEKCKELGRWSFFLSSVPLNQKGGVSSPPSAMAIF